MLAPVTGQQGAADDIGQIAGPDGIDLWHEDGSDGKTNVGGLRGTLLAYTVPCRDVADFMPQYGCQFGFRIQVGQDAARDVDIAAGQCEGVDLCRIQHGKVILQIGAMALAGDALAYAVYVVLQGFGTVHLVLLLDLLVVLSADGNLLIF